jgi:hydrogenase nickel incorporation protein HypA/HybF
LNAGEDMHELSIALGIVDIAVEEMAQRGLERVAAIHLKLGALCGVVPEALRSSFELAREETALANAELVIEEVPLTAFCPSCQCEQDCTFPELCCPVCGALTPDIIHGKELEVCALEIEACPEPPV